MASAQEGELLRQIVANPGDLASRAIYADLLQARGDPRGEFIALELAGELTRARALALRHAKTWWPELALRRLATRNGFIERVAGTATELAAAPRLFATEPIDEVELVELYPESFTKAPAPRARRLVVRGYAQGFVAELIAAGTELIAALDLSACRLDGTLALGDAFANCTELAIAQNTYLGRDLMKLLDWRGLARLRVLDVARTTLVPEVLRELLATELPALRRLRVSGNPLGATGARVLATSLSRLTALEELEVIGCELDGAALEVLRVVCGSRVRLASAVPDLVALDLVGSQLELHRTGPDRWAIHVDGVLRAVRWQTTATDDRANARVLAPWQMAEVAPLDTVATAIASGAARTLVPNGCSIDLGAQLGYVYNTSVYSSESALIEYELPGSTVAITLSSYTSID